MPIYCKWPVYIKNNLIVIGYKDKTIEDWDLWFASNEEYETKRETENFKRIYANYLAFKIYKQTIDLK